MAIIYGTIREVHGFCTPEGPVLSGDSPAQPVLGCYVTVDITAGNVYATANDFEIDDVDTAIETARRDGKTVTILGAAIAAPGIEGSTAFGIGMPTSISSGNIVAPMTAADLTTEKTDSSTLGAATRPMTIYVPFKLS